MAKTTKKGSKQSKAAPRGGGMGEKATSARTWQRLHDEFVVVPEERYLAGGYVCPNLRELAKRFGVPMREVNRRAAEEQWRLEGEANRALAWRKRYGLGADFEEQFSALFAAKMYTHLLCQGPEGRELALAHGREVWASATVPIVQWTAVCRARAARLELEEARTALYAFERAAKARAEKAAKARA